MRLGILFVIEWLTRGTVAGMTCTNTRREFESKLGLEPLGDACVRYGELEIAYFDPSDPESLPYYLMVDLFDEHRDRWLEEIAWLSKEKRELAEAICTLRAPVIAQALAKRGVRTMRFAPPREYSWFVAVGKGAKMGCTYAEPELEGRGLTLFLTPNLEDQFALLDSLPTQG
ncbi:MAG: hypothetical protein U0165_14155 [Polyangiaceae bacterium]